MPIIYDHYSDIFLVLQESIIIKYIIEHFPNSYWEFLISNIEKVPIAFATVCPSLLISESNATIQIS